ncbi:MAG: ABC transporter permease, partial [Flavobacteriales bacterium]|nr:ABC transporter permease [Flavobacteriales bacterium]
DKIRVYFPSVNSERVNVRPFYVCGIFNINMNELDEALAFVSLSKLQQLKKWEENEVSLIEIKVSDFNKVDEVKNQLEVSVEDYYNKNIVSIKDLYPQIFDWLDLMNVNVVVIIILMLIVAVVNIITSLLILILEKTKFIGILKSLGTSNWSIRKVFMYNSIYLVSKGLLWGNIIALSLLFIQYHFQIISLDPELYYMNSVPISFDLFSFIMLNIGTLIVCFVMMILPTIVITKISAVKAIRFE